MTGVFSALALAGAYLLVPVPNVEILTALIFLSGVLFGCRTGMLVGGISAAIFGIFNPYGMSPLPLLVAQVVSRVVVGYVGGLFREAASSDHRRWWRATYFGLAGLGLTWLYIVLALLSNTLTFGFSLHQLKASFAFGIISYLLLSLSNTLVFAIVVPAAIDGLRRTAYFRPVQAR